MKQWYRSWKIRMMERDPTQCELAAKAGIFYSTLSGRMPGHSQDMDTFGVCAHALPARENAPQPQPMICFKTCWAMNPRAPCEAF